MTKSIAPDKKSYLNDKILNLIEPLKKFARSNDPEIQDTIYFSLFLVVYPIVVTIWYLWTGHILVSIPLILMLCCGLLSYRAARAIEKRREG
ncbi:MAG: hypothetical protein GY874_01010 [Desulfobacteraceae bacterium]|nr:hypothetical protein [Desulfobacteraceae bacterium]